MEIFLIQTDVINKIPDDILYKFKHKKITVEQKLKIHCLAYLMTDKILDAVYNITNRNLVFAGEKPCLKTGEKYFSLSHSGNYIAICFSDSNCGIDIEKTKPRNYQTISDRMGFNSNTLDEFYMNWTKFEAEYKLGKSATAQMYYTFRFEEYMLTAVSENEKEKIQLYFQVA